MHNRYRPEEDSTEGEEMEFDPVVDSAVALFVSVRDVERTLKRVREELEARLGRMTPDQQARYAELTEEINQR